MIDIGKILKRAWHILWNYKILWIFGFLLALTTGGRGSSYNGGNRGFNGNTGNRPGVEVNPQWEKIMAWWQDHVAPLFLRPLDHITTIILIFVAVILLFIIIGLLFSLVRYPAETAVLRMVDEYENTGTKIGFKQGWKLGWSRRAFRIWLIDLVLGIPAFLFVLSLFGVGILFFAGALSNRPALLATGMVAVLFCFVPLILIMVIFAIFLSILRDFMIRRAAIEGESFADSFRNGWGFFKRNWKNALLMWLVMLGVGIGVMIALFIAFFLLIPAYIITGLAGLVVGVIPGLIGFGIASIFTTWPWNLVIGLVIAAPFFFLVMFSPLTFLSGWVTIYSSSVWTLTYRDLRSLDHAPAAVTPSVTPPAIPPAG